MSGSTGLQYALRRLHHGESALATQLLKVAERHRTEHEVHHVAKDLAGWSERAVADIAGVAGEHGVELADDVDHPGALGKLREALADAMGRRPEPGLLLLEDLRALYLMAAENSLAWEMLAQHAQAARNDDFLHLSERCHPQTLRQIRWANTMIKTLSPQILTSL